MHAVPQARPRLIRAVLLIVALLVLAPSGASAADVTALPGLTRSELTLSVAEPNSASAMLEALVIRPDGPGPFPLVLITHGMPRGPGAIAAMRPEVYSSPAIAFAQHGYATVIVMRRGYGHSSGPFAEGLGRCDDRDYGKAGEAAASDIIGALAKLRGLPWVDPARILLLGHSMGGFTVLAAAAHAPAGVVATISFAGAVGSPSPRFVCQPDRLLAADRAFGAKTSIPSLWLFARNDGYFSPDLAQQMLAAYTDAGAPAWLLITPDISHDGHNLIFAPPEQTWWGYVAAFLSMHGLPTALTVPLPPPASLPPPDPLDAAGEKAFAVYVQSRTYEKAFATDTGGHYGFAYGYRTMSDARSAALHDCEQLHRICHVYAVNNTLIPSH